MVFEAGLSDFQKMYITVMEIYYRKQKATIIHYCKFKDFNNDDFINDFKILISNLSNVEAIPFETLNLIWVGFLGVRFEVGWRAVKLHPLSKARNVQFGT